MTNARRIAENATADDMSNGNGPAPTPPSARPAAQATTIKPTDLRGILQYVPRFQGQIFVIAIDGSIVADENFGNLLVDIAVLRSLGIKLVLVHGISHQLQELAALRSVPISNADGTGATDAATLDLAIRASSRVSHLILEGLTQNSLKAAITNAVRALPVGIIKGVDQQFTGKVERIDKDFLQRPDRAAGRARSSPRSPSARTAGRCGSTPTCWPPNSPRRSQATKIIFLTPYAGLEIDGEVRHEISVDALRALLEDHPEQIAESSLQQGRARGEGDRDRHAAGPHPRRARLRRPPQRDLLQRGRRHRSSTATTTSRSARRRSGTSG